MDVVIKLVFSVYYYYLLNPWHYLKDRNEAHFPEDEEIFQDMEIFTLLENEFKTITAALKNSCSPVFSILCIENM